MRIDGNAAVSTYSAQPGHSKTAKTSSLVEQFLPPAKAARLSSFTELSKDAAAWRASLPTRGLYEADLQRMSQAGDSYLPIAKKALDTQAFSDPKTFLKTLSGDELKTLQNLHSLADPIAVDELSEEGALNLLLPPNDANLDIDGDNLVSVGRSAKIVFPPANAPDAVDAAWKEATAGLDEGMKLTAQMTMFLSDKTMSIADGKISAKSLGENDIASYRTLARHALEGIAFSKKYQSEDQRAYSDRIAAMLEKFDAGLASPTI